MKKTRTGPISGRVANAQAFLNLKIDASNFIYNTEIEDFRKSIIKALIPQVGVTEKQVLMKIPAIPTHQI